MAQQPPTPPPPPPPPPEPPGGPVYGQAPAYGVRSTGSRGAAIFLLIAGILGALYSLLGLVGASRAREVLSDAGVASDDIDAFVGVLTGVFVVLLIIHVTQIIAASRLFGGRARGLAQAMAIAGGALWLLILVLGLAQGTVDPIGLVVGLVMIAAAIAVPIMLRRRAT